MNATMKINFKEIKVENKHKNGSYWRQIPFQIQQNEKPRITRGEKPK